MYPERDKLKAVLLKESYVSEEDSKAAEAASQDAAGYVDYLIGQELLTKTLLGQAIAESYKVPFIDLKMAPPSKELVTLLNEDIARQNRVVVVRDDQKGILLASDTLENLNGKLLQQQFPHKKVFLAYTLPEYVENSFTLFQQPLETRFSRIMQTGERIAPEMVDEIIKDAITYHASDIHFEPQIDKVTVRFRVDGTLRPAGTLPREQYENVLNRIKVESGMRIDEHLSTQDGSMQRRTERFSADLRVSLVPTVYGEKIVCRVLSSYVQGFSLNDLGLDAAHQEQIEADAQKPFGMILTVGPTGSGKTTTLYALLKLLNKSNVNITTIEDPVEYKMDGINQIQVREQAGMTFAKGLRAIVRQDPDIILVGEIRDQETAEISVNAALTGHLLLSTFHANDAATAVPRLIDMGIEPFLLSSTLEVIIAQRLVRKICEACRYSVPVAKATEGIRHKKEVTRLLKSHANVYAGKGCNVCNGSGYRGRSALFEIIRVTPKMEELLLNNPSSRQIWTLAKKEGTASMFEDGIEKVKRGVTTIQEVLRVVEPTTGE